MKGKEQNSQSLDEILKQTPFPVTSINIEYENEDEEEELDTMFPLEDFEKEFYDDEGNFIEASTDDK